MLAMQVFRVFILIMQAFFGRGGGRRGFRRGPQNMKPRVLPQGGGAASPRQMPF